MTSFTRLGTANTLDIAMSNVLKRQSKLENLQENLTSGKKVIRPSDDPTGAAQAERAITRLARIETDQRALASQRNAIAQAESTLGDVNNALQDFRELVATAGNASHTASERRQIAEQLTGLRDQILTLANRKDTNGLPLFSALGSALQPFVGPTALPQDYTFAGLPGQTASNEVSIPFALDGDSAFMMAPGRDGVYNISTGAIPMPPHSTRTDGVRVINSTLISPTSEYELNITAYDNTTVPGTTTISWSIDDLTGGTGPFSNTATYPSTTNASIAITDIPGLSFNLKGDPRLGDQFNIAPRASVFSVLDDAIRDIGSALDSNAAMQAVGQAMHNIDIGITKISSARGQAGDLLNRADRISANQEKRSIQVEGDRALAEDLDMTKGISDFQNQQTGYQAALQSYAQVQKLSLFNYIG